MPCGLCHPLFVVRTNECGVTTSVRAWRGLGKVWCVVPLPPSLSLSPCGLGKLWCVVPLSLSLCVVTTDKCGAWFVLVPLKAGSNTLSNQSPPKEPNCTQSAAAPRQLAGGQLPLLPAAWCRPLFAVTSTVRGLSARVWSQVRCVIVCRLETNARSVSC